MSHAEFHWCLEPTLIGHCADSLITSMKRRAEHHSQPFRRTAIERRCIRTSLSSAVRVRLRSVQLNGASPNPSAAATQLHATALATPAQQTHQRSLKSRSPCKHQQHDRAFTLPVLQHIVAPPAPFEEQDDLNVEWQCIISPFPATQASRRTSPVDGCATSS